MHEGGIVTPCIIQWPEKIKPSTGFSDKIGHVIDLMPTAMELAGIKSRQLPGNSLSYLWTNKPMPERTFCWEHEGNKAIRKGNWKLVKELQEPTWALYNLAIDPTEMNDLALTEPKRAKDLFDEYSLWAAKVGVKEVNPSDKKSE